MRILITGANGFIGRHLAASYVGEEDLRLMVRKSTGDKREILGNLYDQDSLTCACQNVDLVFHCAGYAHAFDVPADQEAKLHHEINFEGTSRIAQAAAAAGVKRFVYLSSVKAVGDAPDMCIDETFKELPKTDYGKAKRNAENSLLALHDKTDMEVVCLRPAMVYGQGGHGNLDRMAALVRKGLFPPLPEVGNRRSFVHINDLIAAMKLAAEKTEAAGRVYIVADTQTYSGRTIYQSLRETMDLPPVGWAVPACLLHAAARLGDMVNAPLNSQVLDRLLGSACYSPTKIETELGWRAKTNLSDGLQYLKKG